MTLQEASLRLDTLARQSSPLGITLILAVFAVMPMPLPDYSILAPGFALMAVYYWTIHRPDLLTMPMVFTVGLTIDLLGGGPAGLNVVLLLLAHFSLRSQRRVFLAKTFIVAWWGFCLTALIAQVAAAFLVLLARGGLPPLGPLTMQWMLTVMLYPAMTALLAGAQRAFLRQV